MTNWWLSLMVSCAVFGGLRASVATAQTTIPTRDIGSEVHGVFAAKCAACHGSDLEKPKGRFGYVLDLRRIAGNPEMVIPLHPEESELWILVQRSEMPPADSPRGPLSPAQKEIIREWIVAGAPEASAVASDSTPASATDPIASAPQTMSTATRFFHWIGKFHLLMLHFPIALILAAGFGEVRSFWKRNPIPSESVRYCLWLGALAAIPTVGLGWLFAAAGNGLASPQILTAHRWLGTTNAVLLLITAICSERDVHRGERSVGVRLLLMCGVLLTGLTAHLGGSLAHGGDFFKF
jgi:uncharacterized membrane protein